ncbi:MAG: sodium:proton antiporter [Phycisphaerales bacterium]
MSNSGDMSIIRGFYGPKCWILSAIVGVLIGLGVVQMLPPAKQIPGHPAAAGESHVPRVRETTPSGEEFERLPSGEAVPWADAGPAEGAADGAGAASEHAEHAAPAIPLWLCAPFAALLASIALMPFINGRFWGKHFPDFAFLLGGAVAAYYLGALGAYGQHAVLHAVMEYYAFIALVGGLFVVSGGIHIDVSSRATPLANTVLLACGAVLANIVGTTGASMLLIRPFMRMNAGRLAPIHIVMFIFIVSNCGGCLTPIGDPPLYLGFLKGVPFEWTMTHLWPMWGACVGMLLALFFVIDAAHGRRLARAAEKPSDPAAPTQYHREGEGAPVQPPDRAVTIGPVRIAGLPALGYLLLMVAGVFIDPLLKSQLGIHGYPIGATFQVAVAVIAYFTASQDIHDANSFDFHPVQEVGFLFIGIFLTMVPALGYLATNAGKLGLESPTQYYFFTGALSAVLDNAPTYLNFLQSALGVLHLPLDAEGIHRFIAHTYDVIHHDGSAVHFRGQTLLEAISLGAVFFGAMTYIGNGPNFMVKAISEGAGVKMPSFFSYLGLACVILLPVLVVNWMIFIR